MRSSPAALLLFVPCFLAVAPALAEDDRNRPTTGTGFLGEIISIRTGKAAVPPGSLPNPPNTSRVLFLGGGVRVIVIADIPVTNLSQLAIGATVSGTGTQRTDGSIVADQVTFTPRGTPGRLTGQIKIIHTAAAPIPAGDLPNPRGTSRVLTLVNGERVIVITDIPVRNLSQMVIGATVFVEGTPRTDASIIATRIRFEAPSP